MIGYRKNHLFLENTFQPVYYDSRLRARANLLRNMRYKYKNYNTNLDGSIETTQLMMTSQYYHYLVYFFISLTLLAFIFNIMVNPQADTKNAAFVVTALLLVYFITRTF